MPRIKRAPNYDAQLRFGVPSRAVDVLSAAAARSGLGDPNVFARTIIFTWLNGNVPGWNDGGQTTSQCTTTTGPIELTDTVDEIPPR